MPNRDRIIRKVAVRRDGKRRTVIDNGHAVTVENAAARCRSGHRTRLILIVMVRRDHLHAPELGDDSGEHRADSGGEELEAPVGLDALGGTLPLGGARTRAVLGVEGELTRVPLEEQQRANDGDE